jgi:hypothetical protein
MHKDIDNLTDKAKQLSEYFYLVLLWILVGLSISIILQVIYYIVKGN